MGRKRTAFRYVHQPSILGSFAHIELAAALTGLPRPRSARPGSGTSFCAGINQRARHRPHDWAARW